MPVRRVACLDLGSTYTKGVLVEVPSGRVLAVAQAPTTVPGDVLRGVDSVVATLGRDGGVDSVLACSSAAGGLRLAVVGHEREVTAEAGRRTGMSAGAQVVQVASGRLTEAGLQALASSNPDVVLLVGGTDGGDEDVLLHNARLLAGLPREVPVVVAGNSGVAAQAKHLLNPTVRVVWMAANVLPRIGEVRAGPARAAIRELFVRHVIGGPRLSADPARLQSLVLCATPDAVMAGTELLADAAGSALVMDVGGATTDVYSVLPDAVTDDEVAWSAAVRTVEGDLGVRSGAAGVLAQARARGEVPPTTPTDHWLAASALGEAIRRHVRDTGRTVASLREVTVVVGSGGVLRHATHSVLDDVRGQARGWAVPQHARWVVDDSAVLAPAGLLSLQGTAQEDPALRDAAQRLVERLAEASRT